MTDENIAVSSNPCPYCGYEEGHNAVCVRAENDRLRASLHHVKRMADGRSAAWHIADCALAGRPVPPQFCAEEFADQVGISPETNNG